MNGRSANSLRAWGYLVAALFGVVAVERGVQAPSSEVTVTPPAREEVSGVTVALRVAPRAAPTPAPTVSLIDEVLRVGVGAVRVAPGWDEDVPWVEPERDEQDVRDAQIAQEQQGQQEQQAQTERHERPAPSRAEGVALCDRQGMRTEWYRAKHRMMWRCARG
jgi:hypothetical protein